MMFSPVFKDVMREQFPFSVGRIFSSKEPGVWYDPSDAANLDWRRNLLTYTEQFDNPVWSKINSSITPNAVTAPNGDGTADQITFLAQFGRILYSTSFVAGQTYTYSIWVWVASGTRTYSVRDNNIGTEFGTITATTTPTRHSVTFVPSTTGANAIVALQDRASSGFVDTYIWGAQLELGSTASEYQPLTDVNTELRALFPSATLFRDLAGLQPVTTAGQQVARVNDKSGNGFHATQSNSAFRPTYQIDANGNAYLSFDGSDDFLVTSNITPATDSAQIFAGVTKLSDATAGIIAETTPDTASNAGIVIASSVSASGPNNISWGAGANGIIEGYRTYTSPDTRVLSTSLRSNASPRLSTRLNGVPVVADSSSGTGGTGNFAASPLYIGRRAGIGLPFNGHIYGLIVRFGDGLSGQRIREIEEYLAVKTGVNL